MHEDEVRIDVALRMLLSTKDLRNVDGSEWLDGLELDDHSPPSIRCCCILFSR
jgi:hypothetical protein